MSEAAVQKLFTDYAKFGNPKSDGKQISLKNIDKWLKEAKVTDGKKVTTTDTGILFKKMKSQTLDLKQFLQYIEELCKEKKLDKSEVLGKLAACGAPGLGGTTAADKSGVVERMTDTSKYTGSHKERFDAEGKGKGKEGREDQAENSGYVAGYKNKDTYDKK